MKTFEFQTSIKDGIIEIPELYKADLSAQSHVHVIVIPKLQSQPTSFLHYFLDHPIVASSFTPLKREDIYER